MKWTGYNCTCADGWEGQNCTDDIDECESDPCQHGGTCNDAVNSFNCSCTSGEDKVLCTVKDNSALRAKMNKDGFFSSKIIGNLNLYGDHLRFLPTKKKNSYKYLLKVVCLFLDELKARLKRTFSFFQQVMKEMFVKTI